MVILKEVKNSIFALLRFVLMFLGLFIESGDSLYQYPVACFHALNQTECSVRAISIRNAGVNLSSSHGEIIYNSSLDFHTSISPDLEVRQGVENKGMVLQSSEPLFVQLEYGQNDSFLSIASVQELASNDTEFLVVSSAHEEYGISVVAMENNTLVSLVGSGMEGATHLETVTLNRLQTYTMNGTGDPTGRQITATQPVALFVAAGSVLSQYTCKAMPSKSMLGRVHIVPSILGSYVGYVIKVVSSTDESTIVIYDRGSSLVYNVSAGCWIQTETIPPNKDMVVICSSACLVSQFPLEQGGPFMSQMIVSPLTNYVNDFMFEAHTGAQIYISIIAEGEGRQHVFLDGVRVRIGWTAVNNLPKYQSIAMGITDGKHHVISVNNSHRLNVWVYSQNETFSSGFSTRGRPSQDEVDMFKTKGASGTSRTYTWPMDTVAFSRYGEQHVPNGLAGNLAGSLTAEDSVFGKGIRFDGTTFAALNSDMITCFANMTSCLAGFSLSLWMKPDFILSYNASDQYLVSNGGHVLGHPGFFLRYNSLMEVYEFTVQIGQFGPLMWHNIFTTWNLSEGLTLTINGISKGISERLYILESCCNATDDHMLYIGGVPDLHSNNARFVIDELAYFSSSTVPHNIISSESLVCRPGWWMYGGMCHLYVEHSTGLTYDEAEAWCGEEGAQLVTITDDNHLQQVTNNMHNPVDNYLVGLRDIDNTGQYTRTDSNPDTTQLTLSKTKVDDDCIVVSKSAQGIDVPCDAQHTHYICEQPSLAQTPGLGTSHAETSGEMSGVYHTINYHSLTYVYVAGPFEFCVGSAVGTIRTLEVSLNDGSDVIVTHGACEYITLNSTGGHNVTYRVSDMLENEYIWFAEVDVIENTGVMHFMDVTANTVKYPANTTFSLYILDGSNVSCQLRYGNGEFDHLDLTSYVFDEDVVEHSYPYNSSGVYDVSVACDYLRGFYETSLLVEVLGESLNGSTEPYISFQYGDNITINWNVTFRHLYVWAVLYLGNTSWDVYSAEYDRNSSSGSLVFPIECAGRVMATLVLNDGFNVDIKNITIDNVLPISGLKLWTESLYVVYNFSNVITFFWSVENGSHVHFFITFGDGNHKVVDAGCGLVGIAPFNISHNFTAVGDYNVSVTAVNLYSNVNEQFTVAIRMHLPEFNFTVSPSVAPGLGRITISMCRLQFNVPIPDVFYWKLDLEQNRTLMNELYSGSLNQANNYCFEVQTNYDTAGLKNICSNAYHELYSQIHYGQVTIVIVTDLVVTSSVDIQTLGDPVYFNITGITGYDVQYFTDFRNGDLQVSEDWLTDENFTKIVSVIYVTPGIYNISGWVYTGLDNMTWSKQVIIQVRIAGVTLGVEQYDYISYPGSTAYFTVTQTAGTHDAGGVTCEWDFGDDSTVQILQGLTIPANAHIYNYHIYEGPVNPSPITYTVNVTCYNLINAESDLINITIENLALTHNAPIILDDTVFGILQLSLSSSSGIDLTNGTFIVILYGDNAVEGPVALTQLVFNHTYMQRNEYVLLINITYTTPDGRLQMVTLGDTIKVGLIQIVVDSYLLTSFTDELQVTVWGWSAPFTYKVAFQDGFEEQCSNTQTCTNSSLVATFGHTYQTDGWFQIIGLAWHAGIGNETKRVDGLVQVLHSVLPIKLNTSTPAILVPGRDHRYTFFTVGDTFAVHVTVPTGNPLPTNATCQIYYPDNTIDFFYLDSVNITKHKNLDNVSTDGSDVNAHVNLTCNNSVSRTSLTTHVDLVERITNVSMKCPYPNMTQVGAEVEFYICVSTGSGVQIFLDFGDGKNQTVMMSAYCFSVKHMYLTLGTFQTSGWLSNQLQPEVTITETCSTFVFQIVNTTVKDFNCSVEKVYWYDYISGSTQATFYISAGEAILIPKNISVSIDFGDRTLFNGSVPSWVIEHTYSKAIKGSVTILCVFYDDNTGENSTISRQFTIDYGCKPPQIEFPKQHMTASNPLGLKRSGSMAIYVDFIPQCKDKETGKDQEHIFVWTFNHLNVSSESRVYRSEGQPLTDGDMVKSQGGSYKPNAGLYELSLNASVKGKDVTIYSATTYQYVEILKSSINCKTDCSLGTSKSTASEIRLSVSACFDPDNDSDPEGKSNLLYTWTCMRIPRTTLGQALDSFDPLITDDCNVAIDRYAWGDQVVIPPGQGILTSGLYVFMATITTTTDSRSKKCHHQLKLLDKPQMECYIIFPPHFNTKINIDYDLVLSGVCEEDNEMSSWQVEEFLDDYTSTLLNLTHPPQRFSLYDSSRVLRVNGGTLSPGLKYRFIWTTKSLTGNSDAEITTIVYSNVPPTGGQCFVEPRIGEFMAPRGLRCENVMDEGEDPDGMERERLKYIFSVNGEDIDTAYATSQFPLNYVTLPVGDEQNNFTLTINVKIEDMFGAFSIRYINDVMSYPTKVMLSCTEGEPEDRCREDILSSMQQWADSVGNYDARTNVKQLVAASRFFLNATLPTAESIVKVIDSKTTNITPYEESISIKIGDEYHVLAPSSGGEDGAQQGDRSSNPLSIYGTVLKAPVKSLTDAELQIQKVQTDTLRFSLDALKSGQGNVEEILPSVERLMDISDTFNIAPSEETKKIVQEIIAFVAADFSANSKEPDETFVKKAENILEAVGTSVKIISPPLISSESNDDSASEYRSDEDEARIQQEKENSLFDDREKAYFSIKAKAKTQYWNDLQNTQTTRESLAGVVDSAQAIVQAVAKRQVKGQPSTTIQTKHMTAVALTTSLHLQTKRIDINVGGHKIRFTVHNITSKSGNQDNKETVRVTGIVFENNPFPSNGSNDVTGVVINVVATDMDDNPIIPKRIGFDFAVDSKLIPPLRQYEQIMSPGDNTGSSYRRIFLPKEDKTLSFTLDLTSWETPKNTVLIVYISVRINKPASPSNYDFQFKIVVHQNTKRQIINIPSYMKTRGKNVYLAIQFFPAGKISVKTRRRKREITKDLSLNLTAIGLDPEYVLFDLKLLEKALQSKDYNIKKLSKHLFSFNSTLSLAAYNDTIRVGDVEMSLYEAIKLWVSCKSEYVMQSAAARCRNWDEIAQKWVTDTCTAYLYEDMKDVSCECEDPKSMSFTSSFVRVPNVIDFNMVFNNWDPSNVAVLLTCISIIIIFIPLGLLARRMDKKDIIKWGVTKLVGNSCRDEYYYMISVYTGMRAGSGTSANVGFTIVGENGDTGLRRLYDGMRNTLKRGSVMRYLMAVPASLGRLTYIRVWHDGTGRGSSATWFLDKIVVQDIQTDTGYAFLASRWLAVDKEDGLLECLVPAAGPENMLAVTNLFTDNLRMAITEQHLWISLLSRPTPSNFTRVQRLGCVASLLYMTMIFDAMFFGSEGTEARPMGVKVGPFRFTVDQIFISLMVILGVTPINILIINLFKRSSPNHQDFRSSLDAKPDEESVIAHDYPAYLESEDDDTLSISTSINQSEQHLDEDAQSYQPPHTKQASKKLSESEIIDKTLQMFNADSGIMLPYWASYLAWILIVLVVLSSTFFCTLFSQQWGKLKASEWLGSFFLSTMEDIFLLDPVKVVMVAVVLAVIFRRPSINLNELEAGLKKDEQYIYHNKDDIANTNNAAGMTGTNECAPVSETRLARLKRYRKKEKDMYTLIFELFSYFFLLILIWSISYGNRDSRAYQIHHLISETMLNDVPGSSEKEGFNYVTTTKTFLEWIESNFIPNFFSVHNYNGDFFHWRRRRFLADQCNYRVGPARLRQVRVKQPSVKWDNVFNAKAYGKYTYANEDKQDYCIGWSSPPCDPLERIENFTSHAWRYTPATDIAGMPQWALLHVYGGGGYVANLDINKDVSQIILDELWTSRWIDEATRAVFIEFTLYNANVNLFSVVNLIMEFPESNGVLPYTRIRTFRVYVHEGSSGYYILVCEILFMVFLLHRIYKLFKFAYIHGLSKAASDGWNILDLLLVIGSFIAVGLFMVRWYLTEKLLRYWKEDPTVFVNFQMVAAWDEYFSWELGLLVFIYTIKLLGLFNFNKKVSSFINVIQVGRSDLLNYTVLFLGVFVAFGGLGFLLFGTYSRFYSTFIATLEELMSTMLGKMHLNDVQQLQSAFTKFYFTLYIIISIAVLTNTLIVIICDAISVVREQQEASVNRFELMDFMVHRIKDMLGLPTDFDFDTTDDEELIHLHLNVQEEDALDLSGGEVQAAMWCQTLSLQVNEIMALVWRSAEVYSADADAQFLYPMDMHQLLQQMAPGGHKDVKSGFNKKGGDDDLKRILDRPGRDAQGDDPEDKQRESLGSGDDEGSLCETGFGAPGRQISPSTTNPLMDDNQGETDYKMDWTARYRNSISRQSGNPEAIQCFLDQMPHIEN